MTINSGREISDVYLKHAGNESSEDEEGTENTPEEMEKDEGKEDSFSNFLKRHNEEQTKRQSEYTTNKACDN